MKYQRNKRNCSIDIIRLVMALLIVALHTNPFAEYNAFLSYVPSQVLSRLGVPFFSSVTGYYFFRERPSKESVKKYFCKYLALYSIWSVIMIVCSLSEGHVGGICGILLYALRTYFLTGFYQLWYLLAIIYTLLLIELMRKIIYGVDILYLVSFLFLLIGVIMFGYGNAFSGNRLFALTIGKLDMNVNMETQWVTIVVPFFMLGYGLRKKIWPYIWENVEIFLVVTFICYLLEIVMLEITDLKQSTTVCVLTYPTLALLMICLLKHPNWGNSKCAYYASQISNFIFFSHIFVVLILQKVGFSETPTYFFTVLVTSFVGFLIVRSGNKYLLKLIK